MHFFDKKNQEKYYQETLRGIKHDDLMDLYTLLKSEENIRQVNIQGQEDARAISKAKLKKLMSNACEPYC